MCDTHTHWLLRRYISSHNELPHAPFASLPVALFHRHSAFTPCTSRSLAWKRSTASLGVAYPRKPPASVGLKG